MLTKEQLADLVQRIVAGYAPEAIGLFGSHALGRATAASDLDLVVIKRTKEAQQRRAAHVRHLLPTLRKIDVVVLTPDELRRARSQPHTFHDTVARQLKLIYLRDGESRAALGLGPDA